MDSNNKRRALGRGLEQLFSNEAIDLNSFEKQIVESAKDTDIIEVSLSELRSNPYQPRKVFDEEKLNELAQSIKEYGVIQPVIIKKSIKGYEIIAGERRVKASLLAGKSTIPAIIKDFNDDEMMQIAVLENIQREDLSAIEEAEGYKKLINSLGITQEELGKKIGKSRSYITNLLGLLRLPKDVQKRILNKELSLGHAKILSKIESDDLIIQLTDKIIDEDLSVRAFETLMNKVDVDKKVVNKKRSGFNKYDFIEEIMRVKIGSLVKINEKKVVIPFDSEKDLERILEILNINIEE
ncbi:MAG: ParB/RepB/Spo0J family partition protein [Bacilli bacterium]